MISSNAEEIIEWFNKIQQAQFVFKILGNQYTEPEFYHYDNSY